MFKDSKEINRNDNRSQPRTDHSCKKCCADGKFSGKSATAGPNPPVRRSPK